MPMPKPKKQETEKEFLSRFMADPEMRKDYPDEEQRAAVGYSCFRDRNQVQDGIVYDRLTCTTTKRTKTPEGFLIIADNCLAKPGIMLYRGDEIGAEMEMARVYRPASELFKQSVADSFRSKPVCLSHPGLVDATNAKQNLVGLSKDDIRPADGFLVGSLVITDAEAIKAIEDEEAPELSLGYTATFVPQRGTTSGGEPYDFLMTNISGNHIALVPRGRNGRECRVADSANNNKGNAMETTTIVLDGVTYSLPVQAAQLVEKLQTQLSEVSAAKEQLVADHAMVIDEARKERDALQGKLDAANAAKLTQDAIDKMVAEKIALLGDARKLVEDYDGAGKTADQVRAEVCERKGVKVQDKSPEYILARFDALLEMAGMDSTRAALSGLTKVEDSVPDQTLSERARAKRFNKEAK